MDGRIVTPFAAPANQKGLRRAAVIMARDFALKGLPMPTPLPADLRPLAADDGPALMRFYNALSPASIRTFRPLGLTTDLAACEKIAAAQADTPAMRHDVVAVHGDGDAGEITGWCFVDGLTKERVELGLGVADAWQGRGLGAALLDAVLLYARTAGHTTVYLIAVKDNLRAVHLYESRGFSTYGEMLGDWDGLTYVKMAATL
jgi:GNAT superfamily N-acetyltransferase